MPEIKWPHSMICTVKVPRIIKYKTVKEEKERQHILKTLYILTLKFTDNIRNIHPEPLYTKFISEIHVEKRLMG